MLIVDNIYKSYGKKKVLKGVSFTAQKGRILSFLGSNGSGKTTTFRCILDLLQPNSGEILFDDQPINKKRVGFLPEERVLYSDITVEEQIYLIGRLKDMKDGQIEKSLTNLLEKLKITDYRYTKISTLSKGNQQKVQLLTAIINNPDLVILDEPWTGLDLDNIKIFEQIILDLKKQGKCIILSSHLYQPIQKVCDDFVYLKDGVIQLITSKEKLLIDERKVIQIQVTDTFYLEDETIISEKTSNDTIRYVLANNSHLDELVKECNHNNLVKRIEISSLQIDDLLGE